MLSQKRTTSPTLLQCPLARQLSIFSLILTLDPQICESRPLPSFVGGIKVCLSHVLTTNRRWVFSTETDPADVDRQKLYNPANSKTSKQLKGATWNISYGDGTGANGDVWLDVVNIGGVKVKHQAVESALELSQSFSEDSAKSGLLGLGFSSLNTVKPNKQQTWFDNIKGSLSKGLFTADLNAGQFGTYDFGYIDKTKYNGDIFYTKVNNTQGFWGVTPTGYKVGSAINVPLSFQAIVDTGTSLLLLPDETVEDYYSQVAHSTYSTVEGGWIFPCLTAAPDFLLNIGSYQATIPGAYINYAPSQTRDNYCYGGIQSAVGLPFSILGDVFIKSQFVVFDSENGRVGFAGKNTTTASSE